MNKIDLNLLEKVAELRGTPLGAYNIRKNGQGVERHSTENVTIIPKNIKNIKIPIFHVSLKLPIIVSNITLTVSII